MTALLLGILCFSTGHPVLGTFSMIYAGLKFLYVLNAALND